MRAREVYGEMCATLLAKPMHDEKPGDFVSRER